jgi:hypothetical protein
VEKQCEKKPKLEAEIKKISSVIEAYARSDDLMQPMKVMSMW